MLYKWAGAWAALWLVMGWGAATGAGAQSATDVYALVGAKIVVGDGKTVAKGTVVLRDGLIVAVGEKVEVPADARILDGAGLTVYPGLIDGYSTMGMPAPADYPAVRGDSYTLATIRAENAAPSLLRPDAASWEAHRRLGFGAALVAPYTGIVSGTSAVVSMGSGANPAALVIRPSVAMHLNFDAPDTSGGYPVSLMGQIAAARQTLYDAQDAARRLDDYDRDPRGKARPVVARALVALRPVVSGTLPLVVHADSAQGILRALTFAREFNIRPLIEGGTEAYRVIPELKAARATVLLSIALPTAPLTAPGDESPSTLQGLRHRALAPGSASALQKAGVPFAFTTSGLGANNWASNLRRIAQAGLTDEQIWAAWTATPARLFAVDRQLGTVETGKIANLLVTDGGTPWAQRTRTRYIFVDGQPVTLDTPGAAPTAGGRPLAGNRRPGGVAAPVAPPAAALPLPPGVTPEMALKALEEAPDQARPFLPPGVTVEQAKAALRASLGQTPEKAAAQTGEVASVAPGDAAPAALSAPPVVGTGLVPPLPPALPAAFVLRGATVWTVGPQKTLPVADVYVKNGKIAAVGSNLSVPSGTREIDARGKHITPGMIDCHSHTAIEGGVNEGTHIVTAECRIEDVIDADDVNIYRQLAGGTTMANLLHGSANAIGGQNAVVKWRWGKRPADLLFGAPPGIKFALGENPKQSNFGSRGEPRYPATRMGVEKVIRETFVRARDYEAKWKAFEGGKTALPPRRDLQLDAIVELLNGKRLVHCHSYRQDEILMMMRLAEDFGFRMATFQHVLEGYKIADELRLHGAGASTFSDWWAFKIEAWDAIPYNGALLTERGVVTSFNSDSSELARRLNLEAAKAIHWGGLTPDEAIKLVTLNPALQLHVADRVGSIEVGKDADLAVWSGDPLSTLTVCEKTFVDGELYFDRAADLLARPVLDAEKARLLAAERPAGASATVTAAPSAVPLARPVAVPVLPAATLPTEGAVTAFVGATVHPVSGPAVTNGVVLVRGGVIVGVGAAGATAIPAGARTVNIAGLHLYPGLIDADTTLGLAEIESLRATQDSRELGIFSPELKTIIAVNPDSELIPVARQSGVLSAITAPSGGVVSGRGALIDLAGWTWEDMALSPTSGLYINFPTLGVRRFRETAHRCEEASGTGDEAEGDPVFRSGAFVPAGSRDGDALRFGYAPGDAEALAFQTVPPPATPAPAGTTPAPGARRRGAGLGQVAPRPGGVPGAAAPDAALQPLTDFFAQARRYQTARLAEGGKDIPAHERDPRFEAMLPVLAGQTPVFIRADRDRDIRAAVAWARGEKVALVLVGGQEADKCADLLAREGVPVILGPVLNLPARFDAPYDDPYTLPVRLLRAGVRVCLSTGSDADVRRLPNHAAMAASYGLAPDEALKAITLYPAQIIGAGNRLGSIEVGKDANFLVTTGDPLEITTEIRQAYIAGEGIDLSTKQTRLYNKYRSRPRRVK